MKQHPMIALIGILGFAACSDGPTDPGASSPLRPALALAYNVREPFSGVATGCPGSEDVLVSGTHHFVVTVTTDQTGAFHLNGHIFYHFTGTGAVSGREYVGMEQLQPMESVAPAGGGTTTQVAHAVLIAKGGGPTVQIQAVFHLTVTPNGDVTASVDSFRLEC